MCATVYLQHNSLVWEYRSPQSWQFSWTWKVGFAKGKWINAIFFGLTVTLSTQRDDLTFGGLLQLPMYAIASLGCYGLGMLGYGMLVFRVCPEEAVLLQQVRGFYFSICSYVHIAYPSWREKLYLLFQGKSLCLLRNINYGRRRMWTIYLYCTCRVDMCGL